MPRGARAPLGQERDLHPSTTPALRTGRCHGTRVRSPDHGTLLTGSVESGFLALTFQVPQKTPISSSAVKLDSLE